VRQDDWLLNQLPVAMLEDEFFTGFVRIFQDVATTYLEDLDNLDHVVDVRMTPDTLLPWLGSWIGVPAVDSSLSEELKRKTVRDYAGLLSRRGTRRGLEEFLELFSTPDKQVNAEVTESGGVYNEGEAPLQNPWVRVAVQTTGRLAEDDFAKLVADEVPAHVVLTLFVGERQIWPPVEREVSV
jgi:phage tail-like protein